MEIYFSFSFYFHPGNGKIKEQEFKKKVFKGEAKIDVLKKSIYKMYTDLFKICIKNFWLKMTIKCIGAKIISFKCENRTKSKDIPN